MKYYIDTHFDKLKYYIAANLRNDIFKESFTVVHLLGPFTHEYQSGEQ